MEKLIVGGEKLISTARAAEMTKYSKDYVGQLCREGKIECRRVSGHWYIDQADLMRYKDGDPDVSQAKSKKQAFGMKVGNVREDTFMYDDEEFIATARAAELTGYAQDYIGQLARSGEVEARKVGRRWFVGRKALLQHKKHNDSLLASVQSDAAGLGESAGVEGEHSGMPVPINRTVEPGDINFNVRYISETEHALVPEIKSVHKPTVAKKVVPPISTEVRTKDIVQPSSAKTEDSVLDESSLLDREYPEFQPVHRTQEPKGTFRRAILPFAFLLTIVIGIGAAYITGLLGGFSAFVANILPLDFLNMLSDTYGHLIPGSEVEYRR